MAALPILVLLCIAAVHQAGHVLADRLAHGSRPLRPWWFLPGIACIACASPRRGARGWTRVIVAMSGSATSYLIAAAVAFVLFAGYGIPSDDAYFTVEDTSPGFDAHGKLQSGDRIVAVDGEAVYALRDGGPGDSLPEMVHRSAGEPMTIEVVREGAGYTFDVRTAMDPAIGRHRLGVTLGLDQRREASIPRAFGRALAYPVKQAAGVVQGVFEISVDDTEAQLAGPVGIERLMSAELRDDAERALDITALLAAYLALLFFVFDLALMIVGLAGARDRE